MIPNHFHNHFHNEIPNHFHNGFPTNKNVKK